MKTFLLTVALFAAVACATPKNKRDVSHLFRNNAQYLPPHQYPQLNNQYLAPVKESLQLPSTSYGVPFNPAPSVPVTSYGTPVVHHAPAPVPHRTYGAPVVQQAPVYQAPVYQAPVYQAPAPVYQAPVYQVPARVVFDAPVQSIVVSEKVSLQHVPSVQHYQHGTSSSGYAHHQQNVGSNGGYVY